MNPLVFGLAAGLVFGVVDVLLMIPLKMEDKTTAMAFLSDSQPGGWASSMRTQPTG